MAITMFSCSFGETMIKFLKAYLFLYVCSCLNISICLACMQTPAEAREGIRLPETRVIIGSRILNH